mgnify:CR=1 FL=1
MRILLAEAEPVTQTLIAGALTRWGHQVEVVTDLHTTWAALSHPGAPRLAVVASELPDGATADVLERIRALEKSSRTWLIVRRPPGASSRSDTADDVLRTPFDLDALRARVHVGVRAVAVSDELAAAKTSLGRLAHVDALTGVASRAAVLQTLKRELARGARAAECVSVILAGLDGFRRVNDAFGAAAGDAALQETAARIVSDVRTYDTVGRSDGAEFLVVLPGCGADGAAMLAERLRESIRSRALTTREGMVALTSSFGVATAAVSAEADGLLRRAASSLARAKTLGGDRVCGS